MYATNTGSSFHKKARVKIGQILGTKPSLYNNQLLISTGIPSLDNVIGGGLAVGTVLLVEEDTYGSYAKLMLKYFLAEALMTKQSIFVCSADEDVRQLIKDLPGPISDVSPQVVPNTPSSVTSSGHSQIGIQVPGDLSSAGPGGDEKMKIAWRYQSSPKVQVVPSSGAQFGHYYDLTKNMDAGIIEAADVCYALVHGQADFIPAVPGMNPNYCQVLQDISCKIQTGCFGTSQNVEKRGILRIGIHSLGSPLWGENGGMSVKGDGFDPSLPLFLIALRGVLRTAFASALITVPAHLFCDKAFVNRVERFGDAVIRLDSFAGSDKEKNPIFKEYHGLLHLIQLPRLNSLIPTQPETTDLAFKLRRKKFTIEKLHLPPELADTRARSQDDGSILSRKTSSDCTTSNNSNLSF